MKLMIAAICGLALLTLAAFVLPAPQPQLGDDEPVRASAQAHAATFGFAGANIETIDAALKAAEARPIRFGPAPPMPPAASQTANAAGATQPMQASEGLEEPPPVFDWQLVGVSEGASGRFASFRSGNGQRLVRSGGLLDGWRVQVIGETAVRVRQGDQVRTLRLFEEPAEDVLLAEPRANSPNDPGSGFNAPVPGSSRQFGPLERQPAWSPERANQSPSGQAPNPGASR